MFNMAMINSGFNIDEPSDFTGPLQKLINVGFGLSREQPIEEIEIEIEEEEPEETNEEEIDPNELEVEEIKPEKEEDEEPPAEDSSVKEDL